MAFAREHELVVAAQLVVAQQHLLDLGGEDVHAADDQHVVAAPGDLVDAPHRAAGAGQQAGEVAGAVADHRHRLLGERGEHQLAAFAVGQHLSGDRVDDLGVEVVFPDVRAVLVADELAGHARAHDLGQAIHVDRVDAQHALDLGAHLVGPRLGAEHAQPQRGRGRVEPHALHRVGQRQHVGRRGHDHRGAELLDELDLLLGVAAAHRDHRGAERLAAVVGAEAAGEEAVAVGVEDDVLAARAGHAQRARHDRGPALDVALGVADHGGTAGGAGRGVHTHHLGHRHREEAVGVVVAQVLLGGEGEPRQVGQALEVGRPHAGGLEGVAVVRHVVVSMLQRPAHALELQRLQLGAAHLLGGGVLSAHRPAPRSCARSAGSRPPCSGCARPAPG